MEFAGTLRANRGYIFIVRLRACRYKEGPDCHGRHSIDFTGGRWYYESEMMTTKLHVARLALFPPTAEVSAEDHLMIGGCDTVALAEEFGTPLYVYDEAGLRGQCREFRRQFGGRYPEVDVLYAGKAFTSRAMLRLVMEEGLGLDVVSGSELDIARAVGFPMEKVSFAGNNKSAAELELAVASGIGCLVVDNLPELEMLRGIIGRRRINILLRLSPGIDPHTHAYNTTGTVDSKFGLTRSTWDEAVAAALDFPGLNFMGLHFHLGSGIFELEPYLKAIGVVLDYAAGIKQRHGFETRVLSVGGGYGVQYLLGAAPPPISAFAEAITGEIKALCGQYGLTLPKLIVEPGRAIVARAGVALYRVGAIKDIPGVRRYVSVDGGMGDNIRQPMYGARQEALLANRAAEPETGKVTVSGKYCESGDILIREIGLPEPRAGDILAMAGSGAYAIPLSSNYNGNLRPAVVFVKEGKARLVRRRETVADLMRCDID
jgi:diaminopimelate decarboxylase